VRLRRAGPKPDPRPLDHKISLEESGPGLASGLVNTTLQVGGALGLAALSTLAFERVDDAMADAHGDHVAMPSALTEGFELGLYLGAGLAALAAVITMLALSGRGSQAPAPPSTRPPGRRPDLTPVLRVPLPEQSDQGGPR
jgi:hypothetical protein